MIVSRGQMMPRCELRRGLAGIILVLFGAIGCASQDIAPRPPKHPDEIIVPPVADAKFSTPPDYPEPSNPNNDPARSLNGRGGQPNLSSMNPSGMGGGGMGGMGGGGMGGMGAMGQSSGGYRGGF